jgi:hypothetical protein
MPSVRRHDSLGRWAPARGQLPRERTCAPGRAACAPWPGLSAPRARPGADEVPQEGHTDSRFSIKTRWYRSVLTKSGQVRLAWRARSPPGRCKQLVGRGAHLHTRPSTHPPALPPRAQLCWAHPEREARIQCILCLRSKVDIKKSYHCSADCLREHWAFHRDFHTQGRPGSEPPPRRLSTCSLRRCWDPRHGSASAASGQGAAHARRAPPPRQAPPPTRARRALAWWPLPPCRRGQQWVCQRELPGPQHLHLQQQRRGLGGGARPPCPAPSVAAPALRHAHAARAFRARPAA